ncbi:MAG TPA: hypothetical protein VES42_06030 [Pilimelia sp.]|nr:hypothetical protein [Pilimelia sp.]
MTQTLLPTPRLDIVESLRDRCDHCNADGKLHFTLPTGGELAFCGHHANRHTADILRLAAQVVVEEGFEWWGADRTTR